MKQFSQSDLREQSFVNRQDLKDANFSGLDIRGVDFSGALLVNANFSRTRAGLSPRLAKVSCAFTVSLAVLSGLITAYAGAIIGHVFASPNIGSVLLGQSITILLISFCIITAKKGLELALGLITLITATGIIATVAITPNIDLAEKTVISGLAISGIIAGSIGLATIVSLRRFKKVSIPSIFLGLSLGATLGISTEERFADSLGVALVSLSVLGWATYTGKQALNGDNLYRLIRTLTNRLTNIGGTCFRRANLTNANFTNASLSNTDFNGANLTQVCWSDSTLENNNSDPTRSQVHTDNANSDNEIKHSAEEQIQQKPTMRPEIVLETDDLKHVSSNSPEQSQVSITLINSGGAMTITNSKGSAHLNNIKGGLSGLVVSGETSSVTGSTVGTTNGSAINAVIQGSDSVSSHEHDFKTLLKELEAAIKVDPNLSDADKVEALEQVEAIDEGRRNPKGEAIQKSVKTAIKVLKGTIADLPSTEELVKVSIKVLPFILKFFGLS
jgi:Pentapeptide repeats (8 copies)